MRLKGYPPTYIKIGSKSKWFTVNEWFEDRKEFRVFNRTLMNVSEVIDPNYYFFSNHPRERIGVKESEKYPNKTFVIDQSRKKPTYITLLFFLKYPPDKYQAETGKLLVNDYYRDTDFDQ